MGSTTRRVRRGFRTELDPNAAQSRAFVLHAGVARWAYNWGLRRKIDVFNDVGQAPNAMHLHKELNALKRSTHPWLRDVSKCAPQEALRDLDWAVRAFGRGRRLGKQPGFPHFKSKKRGLGSFRFSQGIRIEQRRIRLPRIGWVRLKERGYLPTAGAHILSATVSERAGRWFVSVHAEVDVEPRENRGPTIGLDVGIAHLAATSDGAYLTNPRTLARYLRRLRRAQRMFERTVSGGTNRAKRARRVAKVHLRITNIRRDHIHKFTTMLTRTKSEIVVEDLNVAGLDRNRHLSRAVHDAALGEILRQLKYKAEWYGTRLTIAPRFYPSSRRCSCCGHLRDIAIGERTYHCDECGCTFERDFNAARNLLVLAVSSTDTENACRGDIRPAQARPSPMKQESGKPEERPWRNGTLATIRNDQRGLP